MHGPSCCEARFGGGDIFLKGRFWFLNDADFVVVLNEDVVYAFPARTIGPGTVNQNDILHAMFDVLCGERGGRQVTIRRHRWCGTLLEQPALSLAKFSFYSPSGDRAAIAANRPLGDKTSGFLEVHVTRCS